MAFNFMSKLTQQSLLLLLLDLVFARSLAEASDLKETQLVLYFQDFTAGPNTSSIPVAGIAGKLWTFTQFGTIYVTDDTMTQGPNITYISHSRTGPRHNSGIGTGRKQCPCLC
ncbi:dirigent protein 1-like [Rosa sericea]